jgi:hypothetical protein
MENKIYFSTSKCSFNSVAILPDSVCQLERLKLSPLLLLCCQVLQDSKTNRLRSPLVRKRTVPTERPPPFGEF